MAAAFVVDIDNEENVVDNEENDPGYEVSCSCCLKAEGFLDNPKLLPCGHVICESCLLSHQEEKGPYVCNVCKYEFY